MASGSRRPPGQISAVPHRRCGASELLRGDRQPVFVSAAARRRGEEAAAASTPQECPIPVALAPTLAVRPQVLTSQHSFAAAAGRSLAYVCGASVVEYRSDGSQALRCSPRSRQLSCCSCSPCGRYMAAGEAGGRGPQVLVFDTVGGSGSPVALKGHHHGVRLLSWNSRGSLLVSVGEAESDQGGDHQVILWSWPQAERLASAFCPRGLLDLTFAPDSFTFATISATSLRRWSIIQDPRSGLLSYPASGAAGSGSVSLNDQPLSAEICAQLRSGGVRRSIQAGESSGFAAIAWGLSSVLFVATQHGLLSSVSPEDQLEQSRDLGQPVLALAWSPQLCSSRPQGGTGVLVCALANGSVHVLEAASFEPLAVLQRRSVDPVFPLRAPEAWQAGCDEVPAAVGVGISLEGEALWVLYGDSSMARWERLRDSPDWLLPGPVAGIQDAQSIPGRSHTLPRLVSRTDRKLQLWTATPDGLRMEAEACPGTKGFGKGAEVTALACSSWIVACGHSNGEINLLSLPDFLPLEEPIPAHHQCEVTSLVFSSWRSASGVPLLLASASRDGNAFLFQIEVLGGCVGVEASRVIQLVQLPRHTAALQAVSLMGPGMHCSGNASGSSDVGVNSQSLNRLQLALSGADRQLVIHDLELFERKLGACTIVPAAAVRRSHQQVCRGTAHWVGLCAHTAQPLLFAACTDRRVLQLDSTGRLQQQLRIAGGSELELAGPLRLSGDGRLLTVGLAGNCGGPSPSMLSAAGAGQGVLLIYAGPGPLQPLARLAGHAEPSIGVAFLQDDSVLGCWPDGAMLVWQELDRVKMTQKPIQTPIITASAPWIPGPSAVRRNPASASGLGGPRGRSPSPPPGTFGSRGPINARAVSPPNRGGVRRVLDGSPVASSPTSHFTMSPAVSGTPSSLRRSPSRARQGRLCLVPQSPVRAAVQSPQQSNRPVNHHQGQAEQCQEQRRCPDGLLERLLASSPQPPSWAGDRSWAGLDNDEAVAAALLNQQGGGSSSSSSVNRRLLDSPQMQTRSIRSVTGNSSNAHTSSNSKNNNTSNRSSNASVLQGKWSRGSLVGAQVRSTSDLHCNLCSPTPSELTAALSVSDLHVSLLPPMQEDSLLPPMQEEWGEQEDAWLMQALGDTGITSSQLASEQLRAASGPLGSAPAEATELAEEADGRRVFSSSPSSCSSGPPRRPLPPKPSFSPPPAECSSEDSQRRGDSSSELPEEKKAPVLSFLKRRGGEGGEEGQEEGGGGGGGASPHEEEPEAEQEEVEGRSDSLGPSGHSELPVLSLWVPDKVPESVEVAGVSSATLALLCVASPCRQGPNSPTKRRQLQPNQETEQAAQLRMCSDVQRIYGDATRPSLVVVVVVVVVVVWQLGIYAKPW
ncbi:unnamed protein product [Polarella glacialis]|uniref:Uncharacterized protein n=2 Tax=Polarella glacialis TaxID=89957 RepID=A0A813H731_POLGL|nr:unnamed protein product [Polarella glacialis]